VQCRGTASAQEAHQRFVDLSPKNVVRGAFDLEQPGPRDRLHQSARADAGRQDVVAVAGMDDQRRHGPAARQRVLVDEE
jgi:hypothetical protein